MIPFDFPYVEIAKWGSGLLGSRMSILWRKSLKKSCSSGPPPTKYNIPEANLNASMLCRAIMRNATVQPQNWTFAKASRRRSFNTELTYEMASLGLDKPTPHPILFGQLDLADFPVWGDRI